MLPLFKKNQNLSRFSSFGIGGFARLYVEVTNIEDLCLVLAYSYREKIPFHVLGNGSNSLFDDRGFDGLIIHVKISHLFINEMQAVAGGGYNFALLGVKTARKGLSGLEFASGIPASVGGAVFMNAGAGGSEVFDVLSSVQFVDERGKLHHLKKNELSYSYRRSSFHEVSGVIAEATFQLSLDKSARERQLSIVNYRTKTQPYGELCCGCVFQNPSGTSAGYLIEKCGLKEAKVGGAMVSSLHANFILNYRQAKAKDVLSLAAYVKRCVKEQTGIELEMELRSIPFEK